MGSASGSRAVLPLAPESRSASEARAFLRRTLAAWEAEDLVDDAILAVSELVSNAVLYALPPIAVRVELTTESLRITVSDGSTIAPVARHYGTGATTGRGLAFLEQLGQWGVDWPADGGKIVWVDLPVTDVAHVAGLASAGAMARAAAPADTAALTEDRVPVQFLAVPVASYLALQVHNDAILREFELLAISAASGGHLPARLLELVTEIHGQFSRPRDAYRRKVEDAVARGDTVVDLDAVMPAGAVATSERYVDLLEEAERFARAGVLLVEPADGPVGRLRRWFADELAWQVRDNGSPRPAPQDTFLA